MLQAMGLGGWMFDGIDRYTVLGASGDPEVPGLGFRYDTEERWSLPNPTGLTGVFERATARLTTPTCEPPSRPSPSGSSAQEAPSTPTRRVPGRRALRVRSSAQVHSEEFKECVASMAQYIFERFGKFPGTVPTIFVLTYLQAHHLDLEFYDHHRGPGAYLRTHADHMIT